MGYIHCVAEIDVKGGSMDPLPTYFVVPWHRFASVQTHTFTGVRNTDIEGGSRGSPTCEESLQNKTQRTAGRMRTSTLTSVHQCSLVPSSQFWIREKVRELRARKKNTHIMHCSSQVDTCIVSRGRSIIRHENKECQVR